jgi:hypothetical protein
MSAELRGEETKTLPPETAFGMVIRRALPRFLTYVLGWNEESRGLNEAQITRDHRVCFSERVRDRAQLSRFSPESERACPQVVALLIECTQGTWRGWQ